MPSPAPDSARIFTPSTSFSYGDDGRRATLSVVEVGEQGLPTGRLVACDPFVYLGTDGAEPFTVEVDPGRYRVDAAVATPVYPSDRPETRRHTRIVVRDVPAVARELALVPGGDPAELGEDEDFGYDVDAGTGCFYDASADGAFPGTEDEEGAVWGVMETAGYGPAVFMAEGDDGHSLAGFASGWGDGCYPTWIGRDASGEVVCFVTDFRVTPRSRPYGLTAVSGL
ncbi:DUF4241 domain-containing protein [Streptomyces sp. NPDC020472]|uniref:DUF4241 domain-containing protein n=1 Tax=Streptomyces sp. NPDC020472 TaxID=3365075 RepID=UPI0037974EF0